MCEPTIDNTILRTRQKKFARVHASSLPSSRDISLRHAKLTPCATAQLELLRFRMDSMVIRLNVVHTRM